MNAVLLWVLRKALPWFSETAVQRARANVIREIGAGHNGPFARRLLLVIDTELLVRALTGARR